MMRLRFECPNIIIEETYFRKGDSRKHLAKWTEAWGEKPRLEWVHIFINSLGKVPTDWYLETELRRGTNEWNMLTESFLLTFSFEIGFRCLNEALKDIQ